MLNEKGIKVLSLFFIDEVQKYRTVNGEKGIYAKINLSYSPFNKFLIYLQYAINYKPDNESIGSGYNKIENNYEQLLRFNIAWSL